MSEAVEQFDKLELEQIPSGRKRALVIDDDKQLGRLVARVLSKQGGFEVVTVSEPAIGLIRAKRQQFDVVISDIVMPSINGLELIEAIREFDMDVPIVLITGTPTIETAQKAIEIGAFRYITKPVDPEELIDVAKQASFCLRIAQLKRQAYQLSGEADMAPGDLAGMSQAFDSTLKSMGIAYQPIVWAKTGELFGYEALMRSHDARLPHPGAVLKAAENLDRIFDLGRLIRHRAVSPFLKDREDQKLFLNLHPRDLLDAELDSKEGELIGIAHRVVLEITERESLERSPEIERRLERLKQLGFTIAVDDLGAGYAGLSSFASVQPGLVKLDMSLIIGIHKSKIKQRVVQSMVETCHDLDITVVAEGVETIEELQTCQNLGCDLLQGFFIARPAEEFPEINWI